MSAIGWGTVRSHHVVSSAEAMDIDDLSMADRCPVRPPQFPRRPTPTAP